MKIRLTALLILGLILTTSCYAQSVPAPEPPSPPQVDQEVTVRRDTRSIPYIEARSLDDLYFAQGYETARDRLWQMDLYRRVARGRLAELFGRRVLEEDKLWRRYGFAEIAEESIRTLRPELARGLENYARGVNAYIATLDEKTLPVEFQALQYRPEPWQPSDSLIIGKILADALSSTWWQDLYREGMRKSLSPEKFRDMTDVVTEYDVVLYGKDAEKEKKARSAAASVSKIERFIDTEITARRRSLERIGFYAEELAASNNWVISGKRTFDGKPILANDPHLRPSAPGIWYLTHLSAPGMRVAGATFPGVPGVILGHNEKIAWGATNVGPDVQDVYREEFNAKGEYRTSSGWKKPRVRKEVVRVRENLFKPDTVEETFEVLETDNGVIFRDTDKEKLSLKWTAREPRNQEFEAFFRINRAANWKEFREALSEYGGPTQNFVYADVEGNIGWQVAGSIPVRRKGTGELPYDGWKKDGEWIGYIPFEEMPNLYNPPSGYIVTANQRIVGTDYKHQQMTRQFAPPWRAKRIRDLIAANPKISLNDVRDIQLDTFNIPLSEFAGEIVRRGAASEETLKILKGWNGRMDADSAAATLANEINSCVGNEIAEANRPASGWFIRQNILIRDLPRDDRTWLPEKYPSWNEFLRSCDQKAVKQLSGREGFGEDRTKWLWGRYNRADFNHPLAAAPLVGGQFKLVFENVGGSAQTPNVGDAVSMRLIAVPGDWDQTRQVVPLGQSGDPQSDHWKDQFEYWRSGRPAVFPFTVEAVRKAAEKTYAIKP